MAGNREQLVMRGSVYYLGKTKLFSSFSFGLEYVWLLLTIIHESRPKPFHFGIVDEVVLS